MEADLVVPAVVPPSRLPVMVSEPIAPATLNAPELEPTPPCTSPRTVAFPRFPLTLIKPLFKPLPTSTPVSLSEFEPPTASESKEPRTFTPPLFKPVPPETASEIDTELMFPVEHMHTEAH